MAFIPALFGWMRNTSPERERRELGFALPGGSPNPQQTPTPEKNSPAERPEQAARTSASPAETIGDISKETSAGVEEVTKPLQPHDVEFQVSMTATRLKSAVEEMIKLEPQIKNTVRDPQEYQESWYKNRKAIEALSLAMEHWQLLLEGIRQWQAGNTCPSEFADRLERAFRGMHQPPPGEDGNIQLPTFIEEIRNKQHEWETGNVSDRLVIARDTAKQELQMLMKEMSKRAEKQDTASETIEKYIKELKVAQLTAGKGKGGLFNSVEFYSINQFIASVKNVADAVKKSWGQWSQLKVGALSQKIGLPLRYLAGWPIFGEQSYVTLAQELDHKDDEVKEAYKKHLVIDYTSFHHLIQPGGVLDTQEEDGNRFRAALEYAADHAWLYDLDTVNKTVLGHKLVPGKNLPATWNEERVNQYVRFLDDQNSAGQEKEIKRGYGRVQNIPDIPPMIAIMNDEMNRQNFWACFGITQRALEKGKVGETSAWCSTTLLRYIRDDTLAKKYFPKGLEDKLGNLGIGIPAWITTFFKIDRKNLEHFQQGRLEFGQAGTMARAMALIEEEVLERDRKAGHGGEITREELDRVVAQVMATHTVKRDGWSTAMSIFNHKYDFYRSQISGTTTTIDAGKADDDFYNKGNKGSEVVLMSAQNYVRITDKTSPGDWQHPAKAKYFLEQLIFHSQTLRKNGLHEERDTFLRETRPKMAAVIANYNSPVTEALVTHRFYSETGKPLFLEMYKEGLIPISVIESEVEIKHAFSQRLQKQIKGLPDPASYLDEKPEPASDTNTQAKSAESPQGAPSTAA